MDGVSNFSASAVKTAFGSFDINDDGILSKNELKVSFESLRDNKDSLTATEKQHVHLAKLLNSVFDVLEKVDREEGISTNDLTAAAQQDGSDNNLTATDLRQLTQGYEDMLTLRQSQYQSQLAGSGMFTPGIQVGGMYSPVNGVYLTPELNNLLNQANMMSTSAMMGLSGLTGNSSLVA